MREARQRPSLLGGRLHQQQKAAAAMRRLGSISASMIVLLVVLLPFLGMVDPVTNGHSSQNSNATVPSTTTNHRWQREATSTTIDSNHETQQQEQQEQQEQILQLLQLQKRRMRESYRRPELPVFGEEDIESRISGHNGRNRTQDDDAIRHYRPSVRIDTKKSSFTSKKSSKNSESSKSSKKSSKREGSIVATARPTSPPPTAPPTIVTTALPTTSSIPSFLPSLMPNGGEPPSRSPTRNPTPGPTPMTGITSPPTSQSDFSVEASTYSLNYFFDDTTGDISTTDQDFLQLGEITRLFLDDYFDGKYGATFIITFSKVLTRVVGFSSLSLPIETFFFTTVLFADTSIFYPPRSEVEAEIEKAFNTFGSNFEYLMEVRGLPTSNPFQTISSVSWGGYSS